MLGLATWNFMEIVYKHIKKNCIEYLLGMSQNINIAALKDIEV
jgi:hypothetical protein